MSLEHLKMGVVFICGQILYLYVCFVYLRSLFLTAVCQLLEEVPLLGLVRLFQIYLDIAIGHTAGTKINGILPFLCRLL